MLPYQEVRKDGRSCSNASELNGAKAAGMVSSCRGWRGGQVQRSPWHAYRAAPSQEKGAKKVELAGAEAANVRQVTAAM
jgi:hypothetical protein